MITEQVFDEEQFSRTVLRLRIEDVWFTLVPTRSVGVDVLPVTEVLHVISGCNPGYRETDEVNERRHMYMERRLRDAGVEPLPAVGTSPDGSWVEPSWAVTGLSRDVACDIGREFGQIAVFEIDGPSLEIIRCADSIVVSSTGFTLIRGQT